MTFDAAARRFDDVMARARSIARTLEHGADELAGLHGHASSPARDAEAVVDSRGTLVSLWLGDAITRMAPETVGALIVETARAAAGDARRRRREVLHELLTDIDR